MRNNVCHARRNGLVLLGFLPIATNNNLLLDTISVYY